MPGSESFRGAQFREIRNAVEAQGLLGEELTAKEIHDLVRGKGIGIDSAHEVATVIGLHKDDPGVEVIQASPYRYIIY